MNYKAVKYCRQERWGTLDRFWESKASTSIIYTISQLQSPVTMENKLDTSLDLPFPAPTKQVAGVVNGVKTDVTVMSFSDKIMITLSQEGRLAHWVG